jgi:hypothetical protein
MSDPTHLPRCPHCGEPMRLARILPRLSVHPELRSFECRPCGEAVTEVVENA